MNNKINTLEQEEKVVIDILKELGVTINHNYFRAEKGVRPALYSWLSWGRIYSTYFIKLYYLTFTTDQLIMFEAPEYPETIENVTRIRYEDIENFSVHKMITRYCIQFNYNNKFYYFYVDTFGEQFFANMNSSDKNFHSLKERRFMGLLDK